MADETLKEKLSRLGYSNFEELPGEEDIPMLYIDDRLICGVEHALSLPDDALKALIDETVAL